MRGRKQAKGSPRRFVISIGGDLFWIRPEEMRFLRGKSGDEKKRGDAGVKGVGGREGGVRGGGSARGEGGSYKPDMIS